MTAKGRIDCLIPGLFGPIQVPPEELPDLPVLARLLGRAAVGSTRGTAPMTALFERFGIDPDPDRDPPSAPFCRLACGSGVEPEGYWLHADPVHLRADRDRLLLFDARHLGLAQAEADALVALFNGHFFADGLRLENPAPDRWFLHLEATPRLSTQPLADAAGRPVERSFLRGEDAPRWMQWLNEAQMLFHASQVNLDRECAGRPTVSGIWPWGGGRLPQVAPRAPYRYVCGRDLLALGLAVAAGIETRPLPGHPGELFADDAGWPVLVFWDALRSALLEQDAAAWLRELSRLAEWLGALAERIQARELGEVRLYPCEGSCYVLTRAALKRFWRRPLRIAALLRGNQSTQA